MKQNKINYNNIKLGSNIKKHGTKTFEVSEILVERMQQSLVIVAIKQEEVERLLSNAIIVSYSVTPIDKNKNFISGIVVVFLSKYQVQIKKQQ